MMIKNLFGLLIGLTIIVLSNLFNLISKYKIRFGIVYSSRVGHLCLNIDTYLSIRKKNEIAIFGYEKKIANYEIFSLWQKKERIFFSKIGSYGYFFLRKFNTNSNMCISWNEYNPKNINPFISKQNFNLPKYFKKKGKKILNKYKIKKPFICLHNRDDAYLKNLGGDGNEHGYRNFKFDDFDKSINYLNKLDISSIRVGRKIKNKFHIKNKNFVDMSQKRSNDFNDLFLISECKFLVSQTSGVANISTLFRKKQLLINVIPFNLREFVEFAPGSKFITKKLYSFKKKRFLTFNEISLIKYNIHEKKFFEKRKLKVIDNSPIEIKLAIKEMIYDLKKKDIKHTALQEKFWNSLEDKFGVKIIKNKSNINICNSFLKLNKNLI